MSGGLQIIFSFGWWKQGDNRDGAKAIADVLKVVVPAGIAVILGLATWLGLAGQDEAADQPQAPATEVTGSGNAVQTGPGSQIVQGENGSVVIGMTIEQHEAILTRRMTELRGDLERATDAERRLIENELAAVSDKLANLESSHAEAVEELRQLRLRLADFEGEIAPERLKAAQQALSEGDPSLADALFTELETDLEDEIKLAAQAAFGRGEIAEQEIRWADAARHYARAARLGEDFDSLLKAGEFAWRAGDYGAALRFGEDLLQIARDGADQRRLSLALNQHALNLYAIGAFVEAEGHFREALEIDRATIGERHPAYAIHLHNLAAVVEAQGRFAEAEELYREALEIDRRTIGEGHPGYAIHLNSLAGVVRAQGRSEEAETLYREALEIDRATIGESHPDYATHLNNLAAVVEAQGRFAEAEALYREALEIGRATIGEGHADYAIRLGNLGNLLGRQGKVADAREMLDRAMAILRATLPAGHPHIAEAQRRIDALPPGDN